MTTIKTLSAIAIFSAAVAAPAFAQDGTWESGRHFSPYTYQSYDRMDTPYATPVARDEYRNLENFGFSGRDPSRVGGENPNLNPSGS